MAIKGFGGTRSLALALVLAACGGTDGGETDSPLNGDAGGGGGPGGGLVPGGEDDPLTGEEGEVTDSVCEPTTRESDREPLYLVIAVDSSTSMGTIDPSDNTSKLEAVTEAIKVFMTNPESAGVHVALDFWCGGKQELACDPTTSAARLRNSAFSALPAAPDSAEVSRLSSVESCGGTPLAWSLEGALQFAQETQETLKTDGEIGQVAVLLVSDGAPYGCDASAQDEHAIQVAGQYFSDFGIKTFAMGLDSNATLKSLLNKISVEGGTEEAIALEKDAYSTADLAARFSELRGEALPCVYPLPEIPGGYSFDPKATSVSVNGAAEPLTHDEDCAAEGWRVGDDGESIQLCPASCEAVQAMPEATIQVGFACSATAG